MRKKRHDALMSSLSCMKSRQKRIILLKSYCSTASLEFESTRKNSIVSMTFYMKLLR